MNDEVTNTEDATPADAPVAVIPPRVISNDEWLKIARSLEQHHAVFYKVWEMEKPTRPEPQTITLTRIR